MYSIIKDIQIYEQGLNDNPNPIILIDLNNYDILFWNDSFKNFFYLIFDLEAEKYKNVEEYPQVIKDVFYKIIEELKDKKVYTFEGEIKNRFIKTQVVKSLSYFVVFIDTTQTRRLIKNYSLKIKELEEAKKEKKNLIYKNIRLWSVISSKVVQFSFAVIVFLGIITTIAKDYYLGRYEERERKFEQFMREQNEIKIQMLETITVISESNKKALEILIEREDRINKTLNKMDNDIQKNQKRSEYLIKKYGLNIENIE